GDVVEEEAVRQSLVAVGVPARDEDRHGVVVSDVDRERLAAVPIQNNHPDHPVQAREEVALTTLVVVQPADDTLARPDQVRLPNLVRERRRPHQLDEPATFVLVPPQRKDLDALDHVLLTPFARTKSLTS